MNRIQRIQQQIEKVCYLGLRDAAVYLCADRWHRELAKLGLTTRNRVYRLCAKSSVWPLLVRANTSDKKVFCMIHLELEYKSLDDLKGVRLIVDCGANVGYASAYFLSRFPQARVIAIEPDDQNFEVLRRNMHPYGDRASLRHTGVWSHPTGLVVCRDDQQDGGEWGIHVREAQDGEVADVQATDLATLLAESGSDTIDILKIDIERSEAEVFARNFEAWLGHVRNLVVELHDEECRRIFFQALSAYTYDLGEAGELTICRGLRPAG